MCPVCNFLPSGEEGEREVEFRWGKSHILNVYLSLLSQIKVISPLDVSSMYILHVQIHRIILWVRLSYVSTAPRTLLLVYVHL